MRIKFSEDVGIAESSNPRIKITEDLGSLYTNVYFEPSRSQLILRGKIMAVEAEDIEDSLYLLGIQEEVQHGLVYLDAIKSRYPRMYLLPGDEITEHGHLNMESQEFGKRMVYRNIALQMAIEAHAPIRKIVQTNNKVWLQKYSYKSNNFIADARYAVIENCIKQSLIEVGI